MTVLVDTSVWIQHFRSGISPLDQLLNDGAVLTHPFVIGELACESFKNRKPILTHLAELPLAIAATDDEVHNMIESKSLWGRDIGWIDAHLVASAMLGRTSLWTLDQRFTEVCREVGINVLQSDRKPS